MESVFLIHIPVWAANLLLAGCVLLRAPRNASNQMFTLFVLTIVL